MGRAIDLRDDLVGKALRGLARRSKDGSQARRLLALAAIYDDGSRSEAAKIGDVSLQTVRDWALRFKERGPEASSTARRRAPRPSSTTISARA